jgi:hypothetical protein
MATRLQTLPIAHQQTAAKLAQNQTAVVQKAVTLCLERSHNE